MYKHLLYGGLPCLVGLATRLYRLSEQSIWHDEWITLSSASAPDVFSMLHLMRIIAPEHGIMPVYYALNYFWMDLVGTDPVLIRLFPILLSILSIIVIYALAVYSYGVHAGCIAALCMAMSPHHIWYSQEMRQYSLLVLFVATSVLLLFLWAHKSNVRSFLYIHCFLNILILWTHLFAGLVLLPMGLYVILRQRLRQSLKWAAINSVIVLCFLAYIFGIFNISDADNYESPPTGYFLLADTLLPDVISTQVDLMPPWDSISNVNDAASSGIVLRIRPCMDLVFSLFIIMIVLAYFIRLALKLYNNINLFKHHNYPHKPFLYEEMFYISVIFLPPIILAIMQTLFQLRFLAPKYTIYSTIGLYIAIGCVVSSLSKRNYYFVAAFLVLLYSYQLFIFIPYSTRSEWRQAAQFINEHSQPDDLVLDETFLGPRSRFTSYTYPVHSRVQIVKTFENACLFANDFLNYKNDMSRDGRHPTVWLVTEPFFTKVFLGLFDWQKYLDVCFGQCGLSYEVKVFPGHFGITVYKIYRKTITEGLPETRRIVPRSTQVDYSALLKDIHIQPNSECHRKAMFNTLTKVVGIWPGYSLITNTFYGLELLYENDMELAEAMARYNVIKYPNYGGAYFSLGLVFIAKGDIQTARATLRQSFSLQPSFEFIFGDLIESIISNEGQKAYLQLEEIREWVLPFYVEVFEILLKKRFQGESISAVYNP